LRGKVAVAGIGETTYYKHGKSPDAEFALALQAMLRACEDAGIAPREIDGFASYSNDRNDPSRIRLHGFASFQEDKPGLDLAERYHLVDNLMWGNDYPHHEGTWPHSAEAIERTMGGLTDGPRAKVLGLNAARFFGFRAP
jgi:predicted TIM-barrel fold metal-dependent hydrolase